MLAIRIPRTLRRAIALARRPHARLGLGVLTAFWAGLLAVLLVNIYFQIALNEWQQTFYDALEQKNVPSFINELLRFLYIAGCLLVLVVTQTWLTEHLRIRVRAVLTEQLLDSWLVPRCSYLLSFAGDAGVGPDQRIQADIQHFTDLSVDLSVSLLQSSLMFITFVGVLWIVSDQMTLALPGGPTVIPGYMVWCVLVFTGIGSWLTWWIGHPLIGDNGARYQREADLRLALVRVQESVRSIALYGGERDERRALGHKLDAVLVAMRVLARDLVRLTWVTSGYGWLSLVVPTAIAAPAYFSGALSFGGLMMAAGAFDRVHAALRWFVDNYSKLADARGTFNRILAMWEALETISESPTDGRQIRVIQQKSVRFALRGVVLDLPDGQATFDVPEVAAGPGERLLIVGERGAGKSTLLLALAGLWNAGEGTILIPPRERMMFMPERPYFPIGPLAHALAYPQEPESFERDALEAVLNAVGMPHMLRYLDEVNHWSENLAPDELQRLAFARILLHRPDLVILDGATRALTHRESNRFHHLAASALPETTFVATSRSEDLGDFFQRSARLVRRPLPTLSG